MVIDGNLDEKEWQKATVLEEFTTIVPFNFEDPKLKTTVKIFSNAEGIYVGFINGQRALAKIETIRQDSSIVISIIERMPSPPCLPVDLLIGIPRPHTAKRVLYEGACLGVRQMHFFQSEHTEPSYLNSRLWMYEN